MDTTLSPSHACLSYMRTFEHKFNNAHLHEGPATVVPADQRQPMAPVVSAALQHAMEEAEIEHLRFARDVRPIQSDHPAEAGYQPIMRGGTNVSDNGMGELHGNRANAWRPDASAAYALVRAGHMRVLSISSSTSTTQAIVNCRTVRVNSIVSWTARDHEITDDWPLQAVNGPKEHFGRVVSIKRLQILLDSSQQHCPRCASLQPCDVGSNLVHGQPDVREHVVNLVLVNRLRVGPALNVCPATNVGLPTLPSNQGHPVPQRTINLLRLRRVFVAIPRFTSVNGDTDGDLLVEQHK